MLIQTTVKKIFIILFLTSLLIPLNCILIQAQDNSNYFNINIVTHYYLNGREVKLYMPNQKYDGVYFEIKITNLLSSNLTNFSIKDCSQKINFTLTNLSTVIPSQTSIIYVSPIIPTSYFSGDDINLSLTLDSTSNLNNYESSNYTIIHINDDTLLVWGKNIYPSDPSTGKTILIILILFLVVYFIYLTLIKNKRFKK